MGGFFYLVHSTHAAYGYNTKEWGSRPFQNSNAGIIFGETMRLGELPLLWSRPVRWVFFFPSFFDEEESNY